MGEHELVSCYPQVLRHQYDTWGKRAQCYLSSLLPWHCYRGGGWDVRGGQHDGDQGTAGPPARLLPCSVRKAQRAARLADATDAGLRAQHPGI